MSRDFLSECGAAPYKPASFSRRLSGWLKARLRDIAITGEALHNVQWAAPWRDGEARRSTECACD